MYCLIRIQLGGFSFIEMQITKKEFLAAFICLIFTLTSTVVDLILRYYKRNHMVVFLGKILSFMADSSLPLAYTLSIIINPKRSYQEANRRNCREDKIKCCDDEDEAYQSQVTRV